MRGIITTWFEEKGFGFIKDENGDNRYFHMVKVANPERIKTHASVTFEAGRNTKGLSAFAVKVEAESQYLFIAGERFKRTAIRSFRVYSEEEPAVTKIDKAHTVLSVGLLMNSIRPKVRPTDSEMRSVKKLAVTTFQNVTHVFTEDEIDVEATATILRGR